MPDGQYPVPVVTSTTTTYEESAPGKGNEIIDLLKDSRKKFYLGPDRIKFRVFNFL